MGESNQVVMRGGHIAAWRDDPNPIETRFNTWIFNRPQGDFFNYSLLGDVSYLPLPRRTSIFSYILGVFPGGWAEPTVTKMMQCEPVW